MENWKAIEGGGYEVSDLGRVRNATTGRVLSPWALPRGYLVVGLASGKRAYVHRLVATAFLGRARTGQEVNHRDGVKANNAARNLEWATHSENQRHAHRVLGTLRLNLPHGRGERNNYARHTDDRIREIRAAVLAGERQDSVAARFGISQGNVSEIASRKRWSHVT